MFDVEEPPEVQPGDKAEEMEGDQQIKLVSTVLTEVWVPQRLASLTSLISSTFGALTCSFRSALTSLFASSRVAPAARTIATLYEVSPVDEFFISITCCVGLITIIGAAMFGAYYSLVDPENNFVHEILDDFHNQDFRDHSGEPVLGEVYLGWSRRKQTRFLKDLLRDEKDLPSSTVEALAPRVAQFVRATPQQYTQRVTKKVVLAVHLNMILSSFSVAGQTLERQKGESKKENI
mmetsp:Transcript_6670/g.10099  ORF Transcript_6670/g.10099 Transcript_6670/m.10099 type:complete len:235 (-) Transcript_6670:24-728(-)